MGKARKGKARDFGPPTSTGASPSSRGSMQPPHPASSKRGTSASKHFSLRDAANRVQSPSWNLGAAANLRGRPVAFVKAEKPQVQEDDGDAIEEEHTQDDGHDQPLPANEQPDEAAANPETSRSSSVGSDEDLVVFAGRGASTRAGSQPQASKGDWDDTPQTWLHGDERLKMYNQRKHPGKPAEKAHDAPGNTKQPLNHDAMGEKPTSDEFRSPSSVQPAPRGTVVVTTEDGTDDVERTERHLVVEPKQQSAGTAQAAIVQAPGSGAGGDEDDDEANWEDEQEDEDESDEEEVAEDDNDGDEPLLSDDAYLSDSQLARILAKQEELGIGSEELVLMDEAAWVTKSSGGTKTKKKGKKGGRVQQESEEDEDDELFGGHREDDFDVMDWGRPSLGSTRGPPNQLGLSDSELEKTLQDSWLRDRHKKKIIKQEREELRAEGLLGSKAARSAVKAIHGMTINDLREGLEDFLDGDSENLELPPMAKGERKAVHAIALAFNCKSKSNGSGHRRYPVIYKTRKTIDFEDRIFERLRRKFGHHFSNSGTSQPGRGVSDRNGAKGGRQPFHYKEGEKVGAGASEIGSENRGRAMLEKMGWSKGTALGAANNKGILIPIEHVVKTSRAGLG